MDLDKYLSDCLKMLELKKSDENIRKVYYDVNFEKMYVECIDYQEYQDYLEYADSLFPE